MRLFLFLVLVQCIDSRNASTSVWGLEVVAHGLQVKRSLRTDGACHDAVRAVPLVLHNVVQCPRVAAARPAAAHGAPAAQRMAAVVRARLTALLFVKSRHQPKSAARGAARGATLKAVVSCMEELLCVPRAQV